MPLVSFDDALAESSPDGGRTVLLGNGFSMAFSRNFAYSRLRDVAEMPGLSVDKDDLFDEAKSDDFETVIEHLRRAARLVELYQPSNDDLIDAFTDDADEVKRGLVNALVAVHPSSAWQIDVERYRSTREFLSNFRRIFTLNYDLLLYWTVVQQTAPTVVQRDGFGRDDGILTWSTPALPSLQQVFYLHGAVHYFIQAKRVRKLEVGNGNLLDQLESNLRDGKYPLVVTEGSKEDKVARIARSAYLTYCHDRFRTLSGTLFIHGMAMSENDGHVLDSLAEPDSEVETIYVGLHGRNTARRRAVKERAEAIADERRENGGDPLRVRFYQAGSVGLWEPNP